MFDFIIVGGGNAGCVLASRLSSRDPSLEILLIEAGPDVSDNPNVQTAAGGPLLIGSDLDWKYLTTQQKNLDGRQIYHFAARGLSGATAVNYAGWSRGQDLDYAEWAQLASDDRWGYEGLLPYFKRTENYSDINDDSTQHGMDGPIKVSDASRSGRVYPLREGAKKAWQSLGLPVLQDANSGHPLGIAEATDTWRNGRRQFASAAYPFGSNVEVLKNTLAQRIIIEDKVAVGVELSPGGQIRKVRPGGQVIVSAGAYRSPQLLMLSGIGDASQLEQHGIQPVVIAPEVGRNFHDHLITYRYWKLSHPEEGLALFSPGFNDPAYSKGTPMDWLVCASFSNKRKHLLKEALAKDEKRPIKESHPLLATPRSHLEFSLIYAGLNFGGDKSGITVPMNGSVVMTHAMLCLPTSRGSVALQSSDVTQHPRIDPNYLSTEADREVMREAYRLMSEAILESDAGQAFIAHELVPEDHAQLGSDANNNFIDARIERESMTTHHSAGTCSMGKVVDGSLRVIGVQNLRVVDASVIPVPIAAHYQSIVYALAEQAVDIILSEKA